MKNKQNVFIFIAIVWFFMAACQSEKPTEPGNENIVEANFKFAAEQTALMLDVIGDSEKNPRNTKDDGSLRLVKSRDWTSGFFPGNLWYIYEYTKNEKWKTAAHKFSMNIEDQKFNDGTHDMGFKMYCSFGNGLRLTENPEYKEILIQSSQTLITRFNPIIGCIRSWDHNGDKWDFPVIIDNMMNLEMLFWATKATGDSTFYNIAVTHAETTMKNHFRDNMSTWHVVDYDTITGEVKNKHTHQGFSHQSAWARGQAWGLYGYTMTYRETKDEKFLQQAIKIAEFLLNHPRMPEDMVPYWDFDAPGIPNEPRDASAAAIICSALYELSTYANNKNYKTKADEILASLSSKAYLTEIGKNNHFLLRHSTGHLPHNSEIDVPIIYADYYFLEANLRKMNLEQ